jgi:LPXTG-motif cell wall-anchored protein
MTALLAHTRRPIAVAALASATAAIAAHGASAAPSLGGFDVRVAPTHRTAAPPSYFKLTMPAGRSAMRHVVVGNGTRRAMRFFVSPVDGLTGQTSGAVYANRQDRVRKAARWLTPAARTLELAAGRHARVGFTVRVPAGTPAGQYLAGMAVEDATPQVSAARPGFQVKQVRRTVVGVLVTVPGQQRFQPRLTGLDIKELPGPHAASVQVGLANGGHKLAKPRLEVALVGPDAYRRTLSRRLDTVLPGDAITYPYAWADSLASGRYDVTATLSGDGRTVTRHAVVQLGSDLRGTAAAPRTVNTGRGTPWALLAGVLGAGLLGGLALRRRPSERRAA